MTRGGRMPAGCLMLVEDEFIVAADLSERLQRMGYQVLNPVNSGEQAIEILERGASPDLVVMDIRLNGALDGIQTAEVIRERFSLPVVFLTAFAEHDVIQRARTTEPYGYVVKPYNTGVLRATIEIALYKAQVEKERRTHAQERERLIRQLEKALAEVKKLQGFLPICSCCKKIRDDEGFWQRIEQYIQDHSDVVFSHSICPDCACKLYPEYYNQED